MRQDDLMRPPRKDDRQRPRARERERYSSGERDRLASRPPRDDYLFDCIYRKFFTVNNDEKIYCHRLRQSRVSFDTINTKSSARNRNRRTNKSLRLYRWMEGRSPMHAMYVASNGTRPAGFKIFPLGNQHQFCLPPSSIECCCKQLQPPSLVLMGWDRAM